MQNSMATETISAWTASARMSAIRVKPTLFGPSYSPTVFGTTCARFRLYQIRKSC
jgi:hypothetical protein